MLLRPLDDSLVTPLATMLQGIEGSFRPFDFTPEAIRMAVREGDEHWVITSPAGNVITYGMLRGWADGYAVPSLGVAVCPTHRRMGLATGMILFLHHRAQQRGAASVMLHVDDANTQAQSLYRAFGYRPHEDRWICTL